jgi:aspartyl-tRNA synthetase
VLISFKVDLEMAFSNGEEVMKRIERFILRLFRRNQHGELGIHPPKPSFPRMTYHEAMHNYGSDKPDLRIPDKVGYLQASRRQLKTDRIRSNK